MNNQIIPKNCIKEVITRTASNFKDIISILLVGSYAKGTATPKSDIDFIIDLAENYDENSYFDFLESIEQEFDKKIDLLTKEGVDLSILKDYIYEGGEYIYVRNQNKKS